MNKWTKIGNRLSRIDVELFGGTRLRCDAWDDEWTVSYWCSGIYFTIDRGECQSMRAAKAKCRPYLPPPEGSTDAEYALWAMRILGRGKSC